MKSIKNFIVGYDDFADPVILNFRGRHRFQTLRGGLTKIASLCLLIFLSIFFVLRWINWESPVISSYTRNWNYDGDVDLE